MPRLDSALSAESIERNATLLAYAIYHDKGQGKAVEIANALDLGDTVTVDSVLAEAIKKAVSQIADAMRTRTLAEAPPAETSVQ